MPTTQGDGGDPGRVPEPTLTVAAVARRLGVAPSTLRTWDRRYGLGPSEHTAGSHRRYSAADVERLVVMRRLTMDGVPPAEAARIAVFGPGAVEDALPVEELPADPYLVPQPGGVATGAGRDLPVGSAAWAPSEPAGPSLDGSLTVGPGVRPGASPPGTGPAGGTAPAGGPPPVPAARPWWEPEPVAAAEEAGAERHRPVGGGRVVALPEGSPAARGLARAAMALDTVETARLLREAVRAHGVVRAWESLAMPVLTALGDRWRATGEGIDVEHAFCEAALTVLRGVTASLRRPRNARPVLLACAEDDQHTLPLHVLAAALSEEDICCRMFGVGMPAPALLSAVRRSGPSVVFVYARLAVDEIGVLQEIPRQRPAPRVLVGGRGWDPDILPRCARLVNSLGEAVDEVTAALSV